MQDLRVSLLQSELHWQDGAANRNNLGSMMEDLPETDLVVIPETFASGFTMNSAEVAEPMNGPSVTWMRERAKSGNYAVTGSLVIQEGAYVYNRMLFATPEGDLHWYDKRHLFRMAEEHENYTPGKVRLTVTYRGWRICPLVCYDLRFPVWSRNRDDYDLLLYVANWPKPRVNAWSTLLAARAIENLSFVVGVNRIGEDGNGVTYPGESAAYDYLGKPLAELGDKKGKATVTLDAAGLAKFRDRFPVHLDADSFRLL